MPPGSNHFGMQVGGASLALLAVSGERWVDQDRIDTLLAIAQQSMIRNISRRREAEAKLQVQLAAMDTASEGIGILDDGERYIYMNPAHAKTYGYDSPEELMALGSVENTRDLAGVRKHLGNLHFRLGHLRRAKEHLAAACELDATNSTFWHDLGVVQYHSAELDRAITSFQEALTRDPDMHLAYFWLGNALYHRGMKDEAAEAFQELLKRYPNFTIGHFHLGVIYARQGNKQASEEEFRRVLLKNPEHAAARFYLTDSN